MFSGDFFLAEYGGDALVRRDGSRLDTLARRINIKRRAFLAAWRCIAGGSALPDLGQCLPPERLGGRAPVDGE